MVAAKLLGNPFIKEILMASLKTSLISQVKEFM